MCKSPLHSFLAEVPKVEHHMHIEGSLEPDLLFELAKKNNIALPVATSPAFASLAALEQRYQSFSSLDDFLHFYYIGMSVLLTGDDFAALAMAYFTRAAAQGVRHAEVFFDIQAHTTRGVPYDTVVDGLLAGCRRAERELGVSSLLIVCFLRHLPVAASQEMYIAHVAADVASGRIAGIGLDSSERGFPPALFQPVFAPAIEAGFRRTVHAGEEGGAENVRGALDVLGAQRIDHGRTIPEDAALLEEMAMSKTLVTLCPLSNVCLKGVQRVEELPVRIFLEKGVRFSLNSDDPAYFGGYILENYCAVQDAFGLSMEEWSGVLNGAIEGSWCGDERKAELKLMLKDVVAKWS